MGDAEVGPRHHVMVSMDHQAWQLGFAAGAAGASNLAPDGLDALAWSSGYIEGRAQREGFEVKPLHVHQVGDDAC